MLSMRMDTLVAAIVRQELQDKGREKEALHFHFDLGMATYEDGCSFVQRRGLHLLYQVNPRYSYINVFSAETEKVFTSVKEVKEWKHEVSHDVCWRDDCKVFNLAYFDMARKINAERVAAGFPEVAPAHMSEHNSVLAGHNLYDWVPACVTKDPNDPNNYRRIIELL